MVKKGTPFFISILLLSLGTVQAIFCLDKQIVLGRGDAWRDITQVENLVVKPGKWGSQDFYLADHQYMPDEATDLLLHFNQKPLRDEAEKYLLLQEDFILSPRFKKLGEASAGFSSTKPGLMLKPGRGSLFERGSFWDDFSIEFWLYPALLEEGEVVFSWAGSRWQNDKIIPQKILAGIERRKLSWEFENFFISSAGSKFLFSLQGITPLIPRKWHHHLLRYDSINGLLEYLVDGVPEAFIYTSSRGAERGSLPPPLVGDAGSGPVAIGQRFTGFLDELRISRRFEDAPFLTRYSGRCGTAVSRIFDLGFSGTQLKRIESVFRKPSNSEVFFYYQIADRLEELNQLPSAWQQFIPGTDFDNVRGRFLQIRFELLPDGLRDNSPDLSEIRITYEQDLPPVPPAAVRAVPGNGRVELYWKEVNEEDMRGYLIYYGDRPGKYHGMDAGEGISPIDAGDVSHFKVSGLENGRLYYFAVVAYDAAEPPHSSLFSAEISARPSGINQ
ncbi:hypothetical protein ES703_22114 [subsurface metagenome]